MKKTLFSALIVLLVASAASAQWRVSEANKQSAAWTSATPIDTRLSMPVVSYSTVLVTLNATTTMTAGTLNFEASYDNGATYPFPVSCVRPDAASSNPPVQPESTFALSVTAKAWQCAVAGFTNFGVRLNPAVTGTGTATVTMIATQAPMQAPISAAPGGVKWSCGLDNIGATLTQCQAAPGAGLKLYLTDVVAESTTATAGTLLIRYGTGTNCGTGTTSLFPSAATVTRFGYPANTAASPLVISLGTPIAAPANNAICVICIATQTCTVQLNGYTAQ